MKVKSPPLRQVSAEKREVVVREWLARTLKSYPENASRFLLLDKDPFRNPVGQAFKDGLPILVEEILGSMDLARVAPVLDSIVRIRAVQDFSAARAVAFVFLLKKVLREELQDESEGLATLEQRIDEIALLAFDLFMKCREKIYEIRANEAKRSLHVALSRDRKRAAP